MHLRTEVAAFQVFSMEIEPDDMYSFSIKKKEHALLLVYHSESLRQITDAGGPVRPTATVRAMHVHVRGTRTVQARTHAVSSSRALHAKPRPCQTSPGMQKAAAANGKRETAGRHTPAR